MCGGVHYPPTHFKWPAAICSFTLIDFCFPSFFPPSSTCAICCFRANAKDLDDIIGVGASKPRDDDLEQWEASEESSEYYPPSSYGTYVPPNMPAIDTNASAVTRNPSAATGGDVLSRNASADID